MTVAYLAFGSNLGDRLGWLRAAGEALTRAPGIAAMVKSPVFETEPEAAVPQPLYLNAVARVETTLEARALLGLCLEVERGLGRERPPGVLQAPRTIDLDVLLFGDARIEEPGLRIPHPRLLGRPFVRIPLALVAEPGLRHPVTGESLDEAPASPGVRLFEAGF